MASTLLITTDHAQKLYNNERYYLQIDSHMRFVKNWDDKLICMLNKCPNSEKAILTSYPVGYELDCPLPTEIKPSFLVAEEFGTDGMLRFKGKMLSKIELKPIKSYFWVSGFAFSRATVINEVPYDPYLPFLFFGEETLMNVRLWTHGYDFFAPSQTLIYHLWDRSYRHNFREIDVTEKEQQEKDSLLRVKYFLGMVEDIKEELEIEKNKYGLGTVRTLEEYQKYLKIEKTFQ